MEVGIHLEHDGLTYENIRNIALEAQRAGLKSFWTIDHLNASPKPDQPLLECWTLLSALAAEVKHIRLGALVLNVNNRNPALLAKMGTTLDQISGGRLEFGIGAGGTKRAQDQKKLGYEYEFDAYGISFPMKPSIRIQKLDEGLEIIKRLWTQERATFKGQYYSIADAICLPKPVQKPHPPIWIGGMTGPRMMKVVAKHANGWNMADSSTVEHYRAGMRLLKAACTKIRRDSHEIKISMPVSGSLEECTQELRQFADEGLDLAILRLPRNQEIASLRNLKLE